MNSDEQEHIVPSKRITFGLDRFEWYLKLVKWRFDDLITLSVLLVLFFLAWTVKPFQRQFYVNDLTISHPYTENDRVSNNMLMFYAFILPEIVIITVGMAITKYRHKLYVTYVTSLGHLISVFTASIVTDFLKNLIGRHRPDFLARCEPFDYTPKDTLVYAKDVCSTKNVDRLLDGFRTTPSGHSSLSFAGLFYLSLFLGAQLMASHKCLGAWRAYVAWVPTLLAIYIALSRTEDYKHHFVDIFIGSVIGIFFACWSYFRIFPGIFSKMPHLPHLLTDEDLEYNTSVDGHHSYNRLQASQLNSV